MSQRNKTATKAFHFTIQISESKDSTELPLCETLKFKYQIEIIYWKTFKTALKAKRQEAPCAV